MERERFKSNRDIAIQALSLFDGAREALGGVRSPFTPGHEHANAETALKEAGVSEHDIRWNAKVKRYVVLKRIQDQADHWTRVATLVPKLYAHFGKEAKENMRALLKARHEVWTAGDMFGHDFDHDSSEKFNAIIWKGYAKAKKVDDPIDANLDDVQKKLEAKLQKYIEWDA